ncbi:MAG: hypothetical protein EP312_06390 [Gammaproteobacteria bacterium]|nr:MAG: hypothetical protein EP312_06390 [Gammaproteobacteria bacterium]
MASIYTFTHVAARADESAWTQFFALTGSSDCMGMIIRKPNGSYFDDTDAEPGCRHCDDDDLLMHCDGI